MEKIIVSCLESRVESDRSIYARFLLGPFTDDHAVTIATALRRALLSKVKNTGITAIHIQGISHEFSTIAGVRESVLDLALNFQQIIFRTQIESQREMFRARKGLPRFSHVPTPTQKKEQKISSSYSMTSYETVDERSAFQNQSREAGLLSQFKKYGNTKSTLKNKKLHLYNKMDDHLSTQSLKKNYDLLSETTKIGYLQIRGPAVIYANDLKLPFGIECVDPTQYIATLSAEGLLVVKFLIGKKKVFLYHADPCKTPFRYGEASLRHNNRLTGTKLNSSKAKLVQKDREAFPYKTQAFPRARLSEEPSRFIQSEPRIQKQDTENNDQTKGNFNKDNFNVFPFSFDNDKTTFNKSIAFVKRMQEQSFYKAKLGQVESKTRGRSKAVEEKLKEESSLSEHWIGLTGVKLRPYQNMQNFVLQGSASSTKYLRNTIFLDPILDSVSQVNYIIEKDDLSNQPRERIVLELWTNGSVHPRQAIHQASLSLMSTFSIFRKMFHVYSW